MVLAHEGQMTCKRDHKRNAVVFLNGARMGRGSETQWQRENKSSKDRTWSAVPDALLGVIQRSDSAVPDALLRVIR